MIALRRNRASVTLEPGGQFELSGAPQSSDVDAVAELDAHLDELLPLADGASVAFLGCGFRPLGTWADVPWVPKGRYAIMREYLPTRGTLGVEMMKRTATVQANLDYTSEADAMASCGCRWRWARWLPRCSRCFAAGRWPSGWLPELSRGLLAGHRPRSLRHLPFVFQPGASFTDYVEWALDVPLFFIYRHKRYITAPGVTFRKFMNEGYAGERATLADWELHLSTLFPDTRLKQYIGFGLPMPDHCRRCGAWHRCGAAGCIVPMRSAPPPTSWPAIATLRSLSYGPPCPGWPIRPSCGVAPSRRSALSSSTLLDKASLASVPREAQRYSIRCAPTWRLVAVRPMTSSTPSTPPRVISAALPTPSACARNVRLQIQRARALRCPPQMAQRRQRQNAGSTMRPKKPSSDDLAADPPKRRTPPARRGHPAKHQGVRRQGAQPLHQPVVGIKDCHCFHLARSATGSIVAGPGLVRVASVGRPAATSEPRRLGFDPVLRQRPTRGPRVGAVTGAVTRLRAARSPAAR